MPPKAFTGPFSHKEKVLVPHTDKMYEAKIVKSEKRGEMWFYLIHYQGWSKDWDEWVEAPGLHKIDPVTKGPMAVVPGLAQAVAVGEPTGAQKRPESAAGPAKRPEKRRKANDIAPQDIEPPADDDEHAVEARIPASLKQVLLDEHEAFEKGLRASSLPRSPNILDILLQYVDHEKAYRQSVDQEEQFASGLRTYFDKALYHCLLYNHEVEECSEVLERGVMPSSQYGAEHLLRLLAQLPTLVPITGAPPEKYAVLQDQLVAFMVFLQSKVGDYVLPLDQYIKA